MAAAASTRLLAFMLAAMWGNRQAQWLSGEERTAQTRQRVEADAREWARRASLLYAEARLEDASAWLANSASPNRIARQFITESQVQSRRRLIRRRAILSTIAFCALLTMLLAVSAAHDRRTSAGPAHRELSGVAEGPGGTAHSVVESGPAVSGLVVSS
ncbi:hypothetical protein [Nocardia seriolae]|uniref:Uncharacterized protein n=1 Tax=Nocardia seriolae TaxID=37332 RepID=A0A0B8N7R6_9NOCA|nr:hypothetical protein [Nocardia seriolae]APA99962.1 hypothetical protein NS506_05926 [Nocardia seriolae]MTJ64647.1 hypothetical protein [Nocardia seriolae]MTJ73042.1 hypothetical protein [Nocardia seriolae]MTJ89489.1 hypothetical protein [Nocardia seriolae]MTK33465.1 hypothetical protein [Nocardia seriolae]